MVRPLESLMDEVRLIHNSMVRVGEQLHAGEKVSVSMRAVLEFLLRHGPATVPQIARQRMVTRQHIQKLVNALAEQQLIDPSANDAHKRSPLFSVSDSGRATIKRMLRRERQILEAMESEINLDELNIAIRSLGVFRRLLQAAS